MYRYSRIDRIFGLDRKPVEIATTIVNPVSMEGVLNGTAVDRADVSTKDNTIVCYDDDGNRRTCPDPTEHVIPNGIHHPTLNPHNLVVFNGTSGHFITNSITKNGHHNWQINISEAAVVREPLRVNNNDAEIATATANASTAVDRTVLERFVPKKPPQSECHPCCCNKCLIVCYRQLEEEDKQLEEENHMKLREYEQAWDEFEAEQERKRKAAEDQDFYYERLVEAAQWVV